MNKVPKMISSKDLSYICDMFNWNMNIIKKLNYYISDITDETIVTKFKSLIDMHTTHVNDLISILEGDSK